MTEGQDRAYISMATFCERVLREDDGALSLIRLVDKATLTAAPGQEPAGSIGFTVSLVFRLQGVDQAGTYHVHLHAEHGADLAMAPRDFEITLQPETLAFNAVVNLRLAIGDVAGAIAHGTYWFVLTVAETGASARIPFYVVAALPALTPPSASRA
jgi:hypothetical protein